MNFKTIVRADGATKKYAFDEEGKMLYGWIDEQGERQTGDDAWQTGLYYLGGPDDGAMRSHQWERLDAVDDDQTNDEFQDWYWFYFNANGKKAADTKRPSTDASITLRNTEMHASAGMQPPAMLLLQLRASTARSRTAGCP